MKQLQTGKSTVFVDVQEDIIDVLKQELFLARKALKWARLELLALNYTERDLTLIDAALEKR